MWPLYLFLVAVILLGFGLTGVAPVATLVAIPVFVLLAILVVGPIVGGFLKASQSRAADTGGAGTPSSRDASYDPREGGTPGGSAIR